jgi:hypothetical protein
MTGSNPTDRGKLGTKRHILTDTMGIPLSAVISSASTHDIKQVTVVMDNMTIKRASPSTKPTLPRKRKLQHLCLDKAYNSKTAKREIISRGYVPHLPYRRKRGEAKAGTQKMSNQKNIQPEDGWWREPTHGITDLENCSQGMKRRQRTTLGWCSCHAASSSIGR